ncbi:retrotransposon-related protein [Senna tora]|uniref:Retrotransposon-related protein n=1 Tax=Senna tora TaxID=362788 RepID=A0A834X087_9FABA|nr:retrotransposon-related protein [Senna tora]
MVSVSINHSTLTPVSSSTRVKLCFTCDAPYSWSHKCPNLQFMVLQISNDDDGDPTLVDTPPELLPTDPQPSETPAHHLLLNALSGEHVVDTIHFTGVIQGMEIQVLLDWGSLDNFIQPRLVRSLKLAVEPVTLFKVLVGNGHVLTGFSMVWQIPMVIQGHDITISAHVLEVTRADVILGAQWLATLGPLIADYSATTIKFYCAGKFITLQGEPKPIAKMAQFNHLKRLTNTDAISEYFAIQPHHVDTNSSHDHLIQLLPTDIKALLQRFSVIFEVPQATTAFNALKTTITTAPVLVLPDFSKPFTIETDASGMGVGAVLSQHGRPIVFFSKKMFSRMQNRSTYAREMFAITEAVAKFHHYLIGHFFTIRTDQKSLWHHTD